MSEEWTPIPEESDRHLFAFQSHAGRFLACVKNLKDEILRLRADSEAVGSTELFRVRCQRAIRNNRRRLAREEELRARGSYDILSADMEAEHL